MRAILVVDDDQNVAELLQRQLENSGYRVSVLGRGSAVKPWVQEKQPDLVLLDMILPDRDGLQVLRDLKGDPITADVPVIALTITPDDGTAWELGVVDYLTKPVETKDLLQSIEKALSWQGRVLIVEDDPDTSGLLSAAIRQIGFTPLIAADGYEALTIARRYHPDLILLDLRLPGMDGFEALTHLKRDAVTQTIPIIAVSAHVADADQERKASRHYGSDQFPPQTLFRRGTVERGRRGVTTDLYSRPAVKKAARVTTPDPCVIPSSPNPAKSQKSVLTSLPCAIIMPLQSKN